MLEKHDRKNACNYNYDADISNCSVDINLQEDMDEHSRQGYLNDIDHDIGIENDETNMDHCLYDDSDRLATSSGLKEISRSTRCSTKLPNGQQQASPPGSKRMFLETPQNRSTSPHSMDSWICYSNSSDEYTCSSQDCISKISKQENTTAKPTSKSTKRGATNVASTNTCVAEDDSDVDVYDKINFVTNSNKNKITSVTSPPTTLKSSTTTIAKMTGQNSNTNFFDGHSIDKTKISFKFSEKEPPETGSSDKDDGLGDEEELPDDLEDDDLEEIDDEQLSSLSSNIDTIIVSENGTAKYFKSSSSNDTDLPNKKNKLASGSANQTTSTVTSTTNSEAINCTATSTEKSIICNTNKNKNNKENKKCNDVVNGGLVDVRIIDFAHTTFSMINDGILSTGNSTLSLSSSSTIKNEPQTKSKVHYGPDNGFLTGLNSLKRIMSDILTEHYQEK